MSSCYADGLTPNTTPASKAATARTGSRRRTGVVPNKASPAPGTSSEGGAEHPAFRELFNTFLETELLEVADFPQLQQLCCNLKIEFLTRADALAIYERNWRLIDQAALEPTERNFIDELVQELGKSTRSRDLIDLTFMAGSWTDDKIAQGLKIAEAAYGASVSPLLKSTVDILDDNDYWKQFIRLLHTPVTITISTQRHARVKRETKNIRAASNTRLGHRLRRHVILRFLRTDG